MPTPRRPAPRPSPPARPTLRAQAEALLQNYLAGFFSFTGVLTGQEDRIDAMLEEACRILAPATSARGTTATARSRPIGTECGRPCRSV